MRVTVRPFGGCRRAPRGACTPCSAPPGGKSGAGPPLLPPPFRGWLGRADLAQLDLVFLQGPFHVYELDEGVEGFLRLIPADMFRGAILTDVVGLALGAYNYGSAAIPSVLFLTTAVCLLWFLVGAAQTFGRGGAAGQRHPGPLVGTDFGLR